MDIVNLINMIHLLIRSFLPGFLMIIIFNGLRKVKQDYSVLIIESLFISYIIDAFYSLPKMRDIVVGIDLIYSVTGCLCGILLYIIYRTVWSKISLRFLKRTTNPDIFDDVIDYEEPVTIIAHMKDGNDIIGQLCYRDSSRDRLYISLVDYAIPTKPNRKEFVEKPATIILSIADASFVEFYYEENSKVWEKIKLKGDPE